MNCGAASRANWDCCIVGHTPSDESEHCTTVFSERSPRSSSSSCSTASSNPCCFTNSPNVSGKSGDLKEEVEELSLSSLSFPDGISLVVGCQNRRAYLLESLPTWLVHPEIKEIIIVDWNSDPHDSLEDLCRHPRDPRIRILHVRGGGVGRWILSVALNFGIAQARFPILLKVDADTQLSPGFFQEHLLVDDRQQPRNAFYAGDWKRARNINERHLNGVLLVSLANFHRCHGYNEHIRTYGYDDSDLYTRLEKLGLQYLRFNYDLLSHHPHADNIRSPSGSLKHEILKNLHISQSHPWSAATGKLRTTFECHTTDAIELSCCQTVWTPTDLDRNELPAEEIERQSQKAHSQRLLYFEPLNGLGNRLRALASAAVLAQHYKRKLHVIWLTDIHCQARYEDLFQPRPEEFLVWNHRPVDIKDPDAYKQHTRTDSDLENAIASPRLEIYISAACVIRSTASSWSKEAEWLRREIRPILSLQEEIEREKHRLTPTGCLKDFVAVHIRGGLPPSEHPWEDSSNWSVETKQSLGKARLNSRFDTFWEEMFRISNERDDDEPTHFLLCADSQSVYDQAKGHPPHSHIHLHTTLPRCFDRSVRQLQQAVVDAWLMGECRVLLGSPWSSYTELISRLKPIPTRIAGQHFSLARPPKQWWGILEYPTSLNVGDNIQSLAARTLLQFLGNPKLPEIFVDRDNQHRLSHPEWIQSHDTIWIIENGWYDGRFIRPRWASQLRPLYLSFHLNEDPALLTDPRYAATYTRQSITTKGLLEHEPCVDYLKKHAPIGCRDRHTVAKLEESGISAYLSSCLTLTLRVTRRSTLLSSLDSNRHDIYVVDSHVIEPHLYAKLVPEHIRRVAIPILHGMAYPPKPRMEKENLACELIDKYAKARLIITSRLHCALPALALQTPVLFIYNSMKTDCRFDEVLVSLLGVGNELRVDWKWERSETWLLPSAADQRLEELAVNMVNRARLWYQPVL